MKSKKMLKYILTILSSFCIILCFLCTFLNNDNSIDVPTRNVELTNSNVDYESEFNKYEDAKLEYSKEDGYVKFSGVIEYSSEELSNIDLVSLTNTFQDSLEIEYSFDYEIEDNLFYMNVETINSLNETILDKIVGVPFFNNDEEIDIVFDIEEEFIYLSELTDNVLFENCGWFSRALKKVAKTATVIAVAVVVVTACAYAAPAVIAVATGSFVATTAGTTMFVAGSVATSTLAACATIGAVSTTTAFVALTTAITTRLTSQHFESLEEKVDVAVTELRKLKEFSGEIIYRADLTGNVYKSLTPRPADLSELSFFNNAPYMFGALTITKGVYISTTDLLENTGY